MHAGALTVVACVRAGHVRKPKGAPLGAVQLREEAGTLVANPAESHFVPQEVRTLREQERRRVGSKSAGV